MIKYLLCTIILLSCGSNKNKSLDPNGENFPSDKPYHFSQPDAVMILPTELSEISGLSYQEDKNTLITINDEKGIMYELNLSTGEIISNTKFSKAGDYEGIAKTDRGIFVVRGDGDVYELSENEKAEKFETPLNKNNDVEGLCFLAKENALLLACKGQSKIRHESRVNPARSIYRFDLIEKRLDYEPYLEIPNSSIIEWYKLQGTKKGFGLIQQMSEQERIRAFAPSGIAIHPISKEIYVLSARGRSLAHFSESKELIGFYFLEPGQHSQPEGITFSAKGDLFISNEGEYLTAKILRYNLPTAD